AGAAGAFLAPRLAAAAAHFGAVLRLVGAAAHRRLLHHDDAVQHMDVRLDAKHRIRQLDLADLAAARVIYSHFGHDKILLPDADAPSVYPLHRGTDFEEAVARSRHGTLDEQHVAFRIDLHDLQVLDGHRFVPHPAVHLLALRYAVRVAHHREGTVSAVVLGTVGQRSAGVAPPLDGAGGAFPLG